MKIIPVPKKITMGEGTLCLCDITIAIEAGADLRLTKNALDVKSEIEAVNGGCVKVYASAKKPAEKSVYVTAGTADDDGYTLTVSADGIAIKGNSARGAFFGMQTLRQMIKEYGKAIPVCVIEDKPDFNNRGFYHDITRGRVPTLEQLKKITDMIAYFKINELQLYVEDAFAFYEFDGITAPDFKMTAEEITELDDYCYNHFVELVPSLSTFGHLYTFLESEKYKHLCEYENFEPKALFWLEKQAHHTIDVSNPESIEVIKSMIDQYVPLFRSNKFNICCDETFDLCKGRNAGKNEGEEYFKFVKMIIEHVTSYGKQVEMWGDIVLGHMELAKQLPDDIIMLNWNYEKKANEQICKDMHASGRTQIVCPGTSSWNRFIEELDRSVSNISELCAYGKKHGAIGVLNTNWGDFGNICPWNCELYGMVVGAEKGWNPEGTIDESFEMAASSLLYNCDDTNVIKLIYDIGMAERSCDWMEFMYWFSANTVEGRKTDLNVKVDLCKENMKKIDAIIPVLKELKANNEEVFSDLILAARAVKMMNKVHLMVSGDEGFKDRTALKAEWANWFVEYKEAWLRENKASQIEMVGEVIDSFTTLL